MSFFALANRCSSKIGGSLHSWIILVGTCALLVTAVPAVLAHGAIDDVIRELNAALAKKPDDLELLFRLAEAHTKHEDWIAAIRTVARVEELAPGKFPTDLVRGAINVGAGRAEQAMPSLDRFLAGNPKHTEALALRARAWSQLGKDAECLADYRAALATAQNPVPDFLEEIAGAFSKRGDAATAMEVLADGITQLGNIPSLLRLALDLELAAGRYDDALKRVDALQQTAPRPESWMAQRAAILDRAGRTAEARDQWKALLDRIAALPSLERGSPQMSQFTAQAQRALGQTSLPAPVSAPPAPAPTFTPSK